MNAGIHEHQRPGPDKTTPPFWVTCSFSPRQLEGNLLKINWVRKGMIIEEGIYELWSESFGCSAMIQCIRAKRVCGLPGEHPWIDLDQEDVAHLCRSNANPKEYTFVADLDVDRSPEQEASLMKIVEARRQHQSEGEVRKCRDEDISVSAVLFPADKIGRFWVWPSISGKAFTRWINPTLPLRLSEHKRPMSNASGRIRSLIGKARHPWYWLLAFLIVVLVFF